MTLFPAGTVVGTGIGVYEHVGVMTDSGTIVSASKRRGCVAEESPEDFSDGRPIYAKGYPGELPADQVVKRAREMIGKRYDVVFNNCEHVVRHAHGVPRRSPHLRAIGAMAVGGLALLGSLVLSRRA